MLNSNRDLRIWVDYRCTIGERREVLNDIGKNVGDNLKKLRRFLFFVGDFPLKPRRF